MEKKIAKTRAELVVVGASADDSDTDGIFKQISEKMVRQLVVLQR